MQEKVGLNFFLQKIYWKDCEFVIRQNNVVNTNNGFHYFKP